MKEIKEVAAFINDEVDGVLEYAKAAVAWRLMRPQLAETYYKLANVEYQHVNMLHDQAAKLVKEAEGMGVEYPQAMRDKWDEEHKASIAKMAEAKTYLSMYKGA